MSIRPAKRILESQADDRRRRRQAAARLRLRQHQRSSTRSCCSTISATTIPTTTWPAFRGIRTAASKQSPTCWPAPSSMATASATAAARRRRRAVDDGGQRHPASGDAEGRPQGRMHGFQLWANLPASLKMTEPRYQDITARRHSRGRRRRRHARARHQRRVLGQEARSKASPPTRAISTSRCRRASEDAAGRGRPPRVRLCVRGLGHFRRVVQAVRRADREDRSTARRSPPGARPANRSLVLFDRWGRGHGAGRRRGHPLPAGVGQAARRASRLVRADRDEHAGGAAAGLPNCRGTFIKP